MVPVPAYVTARPGSLWNRTYLLSLGIETREVSSLNELWGLDMPTEFKYPRCDLVSRLNLSTGERIQAALEAGLKDELLAFFVQDLYDVVGNKEEENSVGDLGKSLMALTGIKRLPHISIKGPITDLSMKMATERIFANPDICIEVKPSKIVLVLQTKKDFFREEHTLPEAQLAAEMIASFSRNAGNGLVESQRMYGITMDFTFCTFYRLDMDERVLNSIQSGYKRNMMEPSIAVLHKFSLGQRSADFLVSNEGNMKRTLLVFEALRQLLEAMRTA